MKDVSKASLIALSALLFPMVTFAAGALTFSKNLKVTGNLSITGALAKGSGTFVIDHPLDPLNKLLYHSFVESPNVTNVYDGVGTFDGNGELKVQLPSYWSALNMEPAYQWTGIGASASSVYVKQGVEVNSNTFVLAGGTSGAKVSWQVTGVRHDPYILANPVTVEVPKSDTTTVPPGTCLYEPLCR